MWVAACPSSATPLGWGPWEDRAQGGGGVPRCESQLPRNRGEHAETASREDRSRSCWIKSHY